jgi:CheY-like chemotaxis protein
MNFRGKKILVVEDDDWLRNIIIGELATNYSVMFAKNGEQALQQIEMWRPDLVILDLLLPKIDGFTVLDKLRALPDKNLAGTPVIIVSNLTDAQSIANAEAHNIVDYFTKADISLNALLDKIHEFFTANKRP